MSDSKITITVSPRKLRWGLSGAILLALAAELGSETTTMTTFYPAPAGVYRRLTSTRDAFLARDGGAVSVGTTAAPASGTKMAIMNGAVGIGTTAPASALSVTGGVQLGDDVAACTPAKAGTLRWNSGSLQVCDGTGWGAAASSQEPPWIVTWTYMSACGGQPQILFGVSDKLGPYLTNYTPSVKITACGAWQAQADPYVNPWTGWSVAGTVIGGGIQCSLCAPQALTAQTRFYATQGGITYTW